MKHLLKTICTDITNLLVAAVARDKMLALPDDGQLTAEVSIAMAMFDNA